jgi:16S rRNA (guanine1516-N2)-methyltransferase
VRLYVPVQQRGEVRAYEQLFDVVESSGLPVDEDGPFLSWDGLRLELLCGRDPRPAAICEKDIERRAGYGSELARACGVTRSRQPLVVDAMAGWGVDGLSLAALGSTVVMVEQNDAMWALLDSFLASRSGQRPELIHDDAWTVLDGSRPFDVVYLDPMYPQRRKGALPGKSMQLLARICGPDQRSASDWIERAKPCASARVVLKRRLRDPLVGQPDWQIKGHSVRYDVYRGRGDQAPRSTA